MRPAREVMAVTTPLSDSAPRSLRPQAIPHPGLPCGPKVPCHRPACLAAFPGIATVEVLSGGRLFIARCHQLTHDALGWRADEYANSSGSSEAAA